MGATGLFLWVGGLFMALAAAPSFASFLAFSSAFLASLASFAALAFSLSFEEVLWELTWRDMMAVLCIKMLSQYHKLKSLVID